MRRVGVRGVLEGGFPGVEKVGGGGSGGEGLGGEGDEGQVKEGGGVLEEEGGVSMEEGRVPKEEEKVSNEDGRAPKEVEKLKITLRGLASMQPADRAAVLYAPPVDELGVLQEFCEKVRQVFADAELMVDEGRPLLLHATVVNTVYVRDNNNRGRGRGGSRGRGGRGGRGWKRERLVFDASGMLERYEDQVWMVDVPLETIAICRMGAKKVVGVDGEEDEAYEVEAEVQI